MGIKQGCLVSGSLGENLVYFLGRQLLGVAEFERGID